jgi:PilZ domain
VGNFIAVRGYLQNQWLHLLFFGRWHSMNDELRIAARQRVLKRGTIEFGGGAIDCTVRNVSTTGAALDVASPLGIPLRFTLVTGGGQIPCRVVWRKEKRIGVAFESL